MNEVVKGAVNLCTAIYITIGFFGYVAFCYTDFAGDILVAFPHTTFLELIKFGFCMSVAISFPLVLFPCRYKILKNSSKILFFKLLQDKSAQSPVPQNLPGYWIYRIGFWLHPSNKVHFWSFKFKVVFKTSYFFRFNMITGCLIVVCLIVGILIPDIELVLGLVGSTMGSCICVIFPGMMFLKLTNKDTTERIASRAVVVIGNICVL